MNPVLKLAAVAVLGVAAIVAAAGILTPGKADAAGTEIDCGFFNGLTWSCDISNSSGIKAVKMTWVDAPFGASVLWDETYDCQQEVTIGSWGDHIMGDMDFDIEVCAGKDFVPSGLGLKGVERDFELFQASAFAMKSPSGVLEMCWEAECPAGEEPYELIGVSQYAR